ncbi:MAG: response regulator [Synergistaceae bacterium]|jgi:CheY-like chemotaxis protein|nr:response regulator [Synergistaceae bacterium]
MFDLFFGRYLLEKKYVTLPQLRSMLERLKSVRVRVGVLAIHAGLMSGEQVERIVKMQRNLDVPFGTLAVQEGLLEESRLNHLLKEQNESCLSLGQLMVDDGLATYEQLEKLFREYSRDSGLLPSEIEALNRNNVNDVLESFFRTADDDLDMYRMYVQLFLKNVIRFISRDVRFDRMRTRQALLCQNLVFQKFEPASAGAGKKEVICGVAGSTSDLLEFARLFTSVSSLGLDELARDAVCEFLNLQNGLYLSQLSERGVEMRPRPSEYRRDVTVKGTSVLQVPFSLPFGEYDIVIATDPQIEDFRPEPAMFARSGRVVVADDSAVSRLILKDMLMRAGYEVVGEAADGREAVEKYMKLQPDLVTMDLTMPEMSGIEALKEILRSNPDARVVVVTVLAQNSSILEALRSGAVNYVLKPVDENTVISAVDAALRNAEWTPSVS